MTKGKASGNDREYQVLCRDILLSKAEQANLLSPHSGDGIDVTFDHLGGTNITFDIALVDMTGQLVVAECRRYLGPMRQEDIFAFAHRVDLLRRDADLKVAGVFFTKTWFQIGAVKHATWEGIQTVVIKDKQSVKDFVLIYHSFDEQREKRLRCGEVHLTATLKPTASLSIKVIRADGSVEDRGNVR